ncbi:hypothetical protein RND81_12G025900 [Saponaria officinalis]|uniref:F-box protein n=1 Tax=Saponaria officinalis TaxID=3572 RepID=A0AAW1H2E6_SAPOF
MVIHCLSTDTRQWRRLEVLETFLPPNPTFVGVAQNMMVWAYPSINPTHFSAYHFLSRTVIRLDNPHLGPSTLLPTKKINAFDWKDYPFRLFVAGDTLLALGEDVKDGNNSPWRVDVEGSWKSVEHLGFFSLPEMAMVDAVMSSTPNFGKLLVQSNEDHLLILHPGGQGVDVPTAQDLTSRLRMFNALRFSTAILIPTLIPRQVQPTHFTKFILSSSTRVCFGLGPTRF